MSLNKYIYLFFVLSFLNSCGSKSVICSNSKYFAESNIFKKKSEDVILTQKVVFNNTKNGLHTSLHELKIELFNLSNLKNNKLLFINIDTTQINVKYDFYSNRRFNVDAEKIEGTIKILEMYENRIKIEERITVFYDDEEIDYNGIRIFEKGETNDELLKMKRNASHCLCKNTKR